MKRFGCSWIVVGLALSELLSCAWPHVAHAGRRELDQLLEKRKRPTMSEVLRASGRILKDQPNPYRGFLRFNNNASARLKQLPSLPKVIAFMEKAFPGAIWAPLGRDAVIFGDLLDAFYLSIGQKGRVKRLNASGASFKNGPGGVQFRSDLLQAAGLDLDAALTKRPLVGMDRTSFSEDSQSTLLIRAGYRAYVAAGGSPEDLVHKLNFLALSGGTVGRGMDSTMISDYFGRVKVSKNGPKSIMDLEIGAWTDSTPWHDTFGELKRYADGRVEGAPGDLSDLSDRKAVLAEMIEILKKVSDPSFAEAVQEQAHGFGYEFQMDKLAYAKLVEEMERSEHDHAVERAREYRKIQREKFRKTEGPAYDVNRFWTWVRGAKAEYRELLSQAPELAGKIDPNFAPLYLIKRLPDLLAQNSIPKESYLPVLAQALSESEVDAQYVETFMGLYESDPQLRRALTRSAKYFLSVYRLERLEGTERTNRVYKAIRAKVVLDPVDCAEIFGIPNKD